MRNIEKFPGLVVHYYHRWVQRWIGAAAIVFGRHVFTSSASLSDHVLAHEYCHTLQYQREGFWWYLIQWFYWTWKVGYLKNPFEVEARAYAERVSPVWPTSSWDWDGLRWANAPAPRPGAG